MMGIRTVNRAQPAAWLKKCAPQLKPGGQLLDLASGNGRHAAWLLQAGHRVCAVDIDLTGIAHLRRQKRLRCLEHDLETSAWPFAASTFDGIIVTNYLHRPLFPALADSLRPGGLLIYDTFAIGNEAYGRPSNPAFLLRPGELSAVFSGLLRILDYSHGLVQQPRPAIRQSLLAEKNPRS